ncbi:hypothetical protein ACH5RR_030027 [Cinchona calisaya]|uniref:Uncharacterized protein n=1 Tax=Cinchona calisaya TaxID=153742 RepID=A0ABD2YVM5_9GENT
MRPTETVKDLLAELMILPMILEPTMRCLKCLELTKKILRLLSTKSHTKKIVLEVTKTLKYFELDEPEGKLVTYEMFVSQQATNTVEEALQAKVDQPKQN